MKDRLTLIVIAVFLFKSLRSQTVVFKQNGKWGISESGKEIIAPVYDSIFNFDSTGKVCLACTKLKSAHPNKFIKTPVISYRCNYLNKEGEKLNIRQEGGDTTSVFTLQKQSVALYSGNSTVMTVAVKDRSQMDHRFLVQKDFRQLTFKPYEDVHLAPQEGFYIAKIRHESGNTYEGLVDRNEKEILPFRYSHVKFNTRDSLIVGCTAGQGANSEDDVFDYEGKKLSSYHKHIDLAMKKFVILRVFQPEEYILILDQENKKETKVFAEEVSYYSEEKALMVNDGHWFTYELKTGKKRNYDEKNKKEK